MSCVRPKYSICELPEVNINIGFICVAAHVADCLRMACTVTNDFVYVPSVGQTPIFDRLTKRKSWHMRVPVKLKDVCDILNPQPAAQRVIQRLLQWVDRCDWASQRGEGRPPFETLQGDAIFPTSDECEDAKWWLTDISRDNPNLLKKLPYELDSPGEDDEANTGSEKHDTDNIEDSESSDVEAVAVGELNLIQLSSATALANHEPGICWPIGRTESAPVLYHFHGYFERQEAAKCGMHALNNAIGFMFCTAKDLAHACDAYLQDNPYELRGANAAPTGWYSSEVMAKALQSTVAWKCALRWGLQPLHVDPTVLQAEHVVGAVVNLRAKQHWVAIRYWEAEYWLLDSQVEPARLSPLEYRFYIKRHRDAYPILRAQRDDDTSMRVAADTCSTAVDSNDTFATTFTDTVASAGAGNSSSYGFGGSMAVPVADMSPCASAEQRTCSQLSPIASDGSKQPPGPGQGNDMTTTGSLQGDSMQTSDAIDVTDTSTPVLAPPRHGRGILYANDQARAERPQSDAVHLGNVVDDVAMSDSSVVTTNGHCSSSGKRFKSRMST